MRAVQCTRWGGPETLTLAEVAPPALQSGEIRVAVAAAGVNFADLLMIAGKYQENPPLPFSPGFEIAGTVEELAPGLTAWRRGDRVMGMLPFGGYAEQVALPAERAIAMPPSLEFAAAGGFPVAYGTAYGAFAWRARLRPGERVLVFGAAGGVGLASVAVARVLGGEVIAVASGRERLAVAAAHGAAHLIDSGSEDVAAQVRALTGGRGVDVVLDPVGGPAFETALRCLASEGRLVVIGFASGQVGTLSAGVALGKNIDLIGCYWGAYRDAADADRIRRAYDELGRWVEAGKIAPHVAARVPLAESPRALALMSSRTLAGKIVLVP